MNRPTPVKPDNFFLMIFRALRQRRIPLALRIASTNIFLVALALVIYACVMGLQFKQAMHEQADALGQSLTTQTATSATELLVSNDILSLNVLLGNLVKNPLVAHAAIYSVDNRILAEAGQRPRNSLLGEAEGLYQTKITFQDVTAGQLRISLDMSQFQQPMLISLQSMGILGAILLALALSLSLRQGRHITLPLLQLRVWLRDPHPYTPAIDRQDEIGDIARQLHARLAPPPPPEPEPEPEEEEDEDDFDDLHEAAPPAKPAPRAKVSAAQADEDEDEDDAAFAGLLDEESAPKAAVVESDEPQNSAVLAVQLGSQEQLRRLPRTRLTELLERYRDCLEQAASLYEGETHTLNDGSTLVLFHSRDCGEDYLTNAICCGELLRALGHALQIEVADSGITLQLQLGLALGDDLQGLEQVDLLMAEKAQDALALSQHSRNLLLVERQISDDALIRQRARIRPIASPEGACCVERLMEPYPSMLERQLARMHERRA
ncbi:AhpA/YtjB family protein [Pseudomonas sp. NBRC 111131]|uniref:AhpA/YtjB family protein n=1 Tax=Pseudomonas sp. NBRC 111131 TaxID=1661046 RepID=UPI0006D43658|nr:AhpA/YtjB family protein [Pseudomonas sp. NBRC 111131]